MFSQSTESKKEKGQIDKIRDEREILQKTPMTFLKNHDYVP